MNRSSPAIERRSSKRVKTFCAALVGSAALFAVYVHAVAPPNLPDDAYITLRYVENAFNGTPPVYNAGERVFGVSTPLYTGWLILLKSLLRGVELPVLAARGNVIFLLAAAVLAWLLLDRLRVGAVGASVICSAILVSDDVLRESIGGMECSLFMALLFGGMLAILEERDGMGIALASLSALARPEGLLLLAIALLAWLNPRQGRSRPPGALAGLLPMIVWIAIAWVWYGTPVPHSIIAKARPLSVLAPGFAILAVALKIGYWFLYLPYRTPLMIGAGPATYGIINDWVVPVYSVSAAAVTFWAAHAWWRESGAQENRRILIPPLFLAALLAFYAASNPEMMPWYYPAIFAIWSLVVLAPAFFPGPISRVNRSCRAAVAACLLASTILIVVVKLDSPVENLIAHGSTPVGRQEILSAYVRAGAWIEENSARDDTVAAGEIGVLGYVLDRRILDACGLVTPAALPFLPVPAEQRGGESVVINVDFIKATLPDFVVSLTAFIDTSLLQSPWFQSNYEMVHQEAMPGQSHRFRAVMVFRRRS